MTTEGMPKKTRAKKAASELEVLIPAAEELPPSPHRLKQLTIRNFRCIGPVPVTIELDQIVVLVGANNAGKSTILRAYEVVMNDSALTIHDFPNNVVGGDAGQQPEIELQIYVTDAPPAKKWIDDQGVVRERWRWEGIGTKPVRQGFDVEAGAWSDQMPWGAANVAKARRPQPHRIGAFDAPEKQGEQITALLLQALKQRLEALETQDAGDEPVRSPYGDLLDTFAKLQHLVVEQARQDIEAAEAQLSTFIDGVFQGYKVKLEVSPTDDLKAAAFNAFKAGTTLRMGHGDGHLTAIDQQGSGARRALMWAALQYLCESDAGKKTVSSRPHLLLLDEPELCLHPNAVRKACRLLYDLPKAGNWQVMVTTHSPAFVDLSRDNTTIVRVGRNDGGTITATTVFRPANVHLDDDDKAELKLLNLYDPYVAEFFFGGRVVLVEGDTEYTAFKHVAAAHEADPDFQDVHVIRARGKVTIALLARILNAFQAPYAVLHDSDAPTCQRDGKTQVNPAWTNNTKIRDAVAAAQGDTRLVALVPGFEGAFFGTSVKGEKPYNALATLRADPTAMAKVTQLLRGLVDRRSALPSGCVDWNEIDQLAVAHAAAPL